MGAQVEALHAVLDTAGRGEHERAHGQTQPVHGAHDLVAGKHRQVTVEEHHVVLSPREQVQRLDAGAGQTGRIPLVPETVVQHGRQIGVVLDDQDPRHIPLPPIPIHGLHAIAFGSPLCPVWVCVR